VTQLRRTPDLDPGITRVAFADGPDGLYRLVTDALLTATGPAYWVDGGNEAATRRLYAASSDRLTLARLRVARAFTAYQHRTLVDRLESRVGGDAALVVCSSLPSLYADDDLLAGDDRALFRASAKALLRVRRRFDVPVLVTHAADAPFTDLLDECADRSLRCERTRRGVVFRGDGVATEPFEPVAGEQATLGAFEERAADAPRPRRREPSVEV
jgi:hypothetical protein